MCMGEGGAVGTELLCFVHFHPYLYVLSHKTAGILGLPC